jgi:hypothetical protein
LVWRGRALEVGVITVRGSWPGRQARPPMT